MTKEISKDELLQDIDNTSKAIITMGQRLIAISPHMHVFDIFLIAVLNRTVNLNKAFTSLIRDKNFIAAAPLVRVNLDSLLRIYAARISEYDINTFALKVMQGDFIRRMKANDSNEKLTDTYLVEQISKVEDMEWVKKVYEAGNSFVHFGDNIIFSSQQITNEEQRTIGLSIGFHDAFIPESEKYGAVVWMDKITASIIMQGQIWMLEKSKAIGLDIEKLNDMGFVKKARPHNTG